MIVNKGDCFEKEFGVYFRSVFYVYDTNNQNHHYFRFFTILNVCKKRKQLSVSYRT